MSGTPLDELLARIDAAERRLAAQAANPPAGLTDADPASGERWDAGQAWAHLAEFVPYWLRQIEVVLAGQAAGTDGGAAPFGRTRADPGRIGAIETGRREPPADQMARLAASLGVVRRRAAAFSAADWEAIGQHPTLGEMSVARIADRFIVSHLEEHAEQLERLAAADG
ncbi:MAG TPA: DinB family protein [Candidatus Limnocylindria bacterium]|nr:DinB family protein [Candidatus Limnocylindria bacterium]